MLSFLEIMAHWSPFTVWLVSICNERGLGHINDLSQDQKKTLKAEFDRLQQPPPEAKEIKGEKGVP